MKADINTLYADYLRDEAPALVMTSSLDGRIIEANDYAKLIIGEDLIQKHLLDVIVDFSDALKIEELGRTPEKEFMFDLSTSKGLPRSFIFRFVRVNGQIVALGRQDMREEGRMHREMVELNNELSNLTRTLHKQNAELKRLGELKNRFLGMAAHDLRNPAGVVFSASDFLCNHAKGNLNPEQLQFLEIIRKSSHSMLGLIRDFLDVSVMESGKLKLVFGQHRIADVIDCALPLCAPKAEAKQVLIVVDPMESIPLVPMDPSKVEQVLTNLMRNAIEHSHPQSTVRIATRKEGEEIIISVIDHGVGISPEGISGLFDFFVGGVSSKTGNEESTGLGLVISRMIVEQHKGRIWVDSEPGKGSTFNFSLPLERGE